MNMVFFNGLIASICFSMIRENALRPSQGAFPFIRDNVSVRLLKGSQKLKIRLL